MGIYVVAGRWHPYHPKWTMMSAEWMWGSGSAYDENAKPNLHVNVGALQSIQDEVGLTAIRSLEFG